MLAAWENANNNKKHVCRKYDLKDLKDIGPYQVSNCQFLRGNSLYGVTMKIAGKDSTEISTNGLIAVLLIMPRQS
jgi:hypothetical protein